MVIKLTFHQTQISTDKADDIVCQPELVANQIY